MARLLPSAVLPSSPVAAAHLTSDCVEAVAFAYSKRLEMLMVALDISAVTF